MRIVSQQRNISFNFDNTTIWVQYESIYARPYGELKNNLIASYSSVKRANEVFEDLHNTYCGLNSVVFQNIDVSDDLLTEMRKQPKPIIVRTERDNQKVEMLPTVYYMPEE